MSCIVGLAHDGRVWLGGDSAATSAEEDLTVTYTASKVFRKARLVIGAVESFRMRDLLKHQFTPPRCKKGQDDEKYMYEDVVEEMRATFLAGGFDLEEDGAEDGEPSGAMLIGFNGRLFMLDWDYHLGEVGDPFMAIGAGAPFALGSLQATVGLTHKYSPKLRVLNALRTSEHYCPSVRAPFRVISGK